MKKLAFAHLKGGVGKTTAAVNIAALAAEASLSTLLVDMDPQAAASYLLRLGSGEGAQAKKLVSPKKSLRDFILATEYQGFDVLPATLSFRKLPQLLSDEKGGKDRVDSMLETVGKGYDLVVVDAPAGLNFEVESILRGANLIVVPLVPSPLARRSFELFREFAGKHKAVARLRGFFSMVNGRRRVHQDTLKEMEGRYPEIWPIEIPYSATVERMTTERAPIIYVKGGRRPADQYRVLWQRVSAELGFTAFKTETGGTAEPRTQGAAGNAAADARGGSPGRRRAALERAESD